MRLMRAAFLSGACMTCHGEGRVRARSPSRAPPFLLPVLAGGAAHGENVVDGHSHQRQIPAVAVTLDKPQEKLLRSKVRVERKDRESILDQ